MVTRWHLVLLSSCEETIVNWSTARERHTMARYLALLGELKKKTKKKNKQTKKKEKKGRRNKIYAFNAFTRILWAGSCSAMVARHFLDYGCHLHVCASASPLIRRNGSTKLSRGTAHSDRGEFPAVRLLGPAFLVDRCGGPDIHDVASGFSHSLQAGERHPLVCRHSTRARTELLIATPSERPSS